MLRFLEKPVLTGWAQVRYRYSSSFTEQIENSTTTTITSAIGRSPRPSGCYAADGHDVRMKGVTLNALIPIFVQHEGSAIFMQHVSAGRDPWSGKVVLLTGAAGTVGREILHQLATRDLRAIIGIDNNESALFFLARVRRIRQRLVRAHGRR